MGCVWGMMVVWGVGNVPFLELGSLCPKCSHYANLRTYTFIFLLFNINI